MKVVILGAGPGGLMAANRIKELCREKCSITVVDRKPDFSFGMSWLKIMIGSKNPEEIIRSREKLNDKGIYFLEAEIQNISCEEKVVKTSKTDLTYDCLVVALGAELAPKNVEGLEEAEYHHMYTLDDAIKLREALNSFSSGKVTIVICSTPFKCPAAPYEVAMLIDSYVKNKGIRKKTEIQVFTPEPFPMPTAGPDVGNALIDMLKAKEIKFHSNTKLIKVAGASRELIFENGRKENYDLLIAIPPHTSPRVVKDCGLTDDSGWIPANQKTMETKHKNVFAIGDISLIKLFAGKPLPKAAVFAMGQAEVVANNIASRILDIEAKNFDGVGECYVETGENMAAFGIGNFYATPLPTISLQKPSEDFYRLKELWGEYWLRRLL